MIKKKYLTCWQHKRFILDCENGLQYQRKVSMSMHWFSKGKLKYIFVNIVKPLSAWAFAFCSFLPQALKLFEITETGWKIVGEWWQLLITGIWIVTAVIVFGFQFYFFIKQKRWAVVSLQNKLYGAAMRAQEKSNEAKMKSILQITYGNVPEWNPRNYESNVLLYDGHEHLRRILLDMRDALRDIMSTEEKQIDADAVSVDLVYCYPGKECDGMLPVDASNGANSKSIDAWRVITSGNSSIMATREEGKKNIRGFLNDENSFYINLAKKGYDFRNEKCRATKKAKKAGKQRKYCLCLCKEQRETGNGSTNGSDGFIPSIKDEEYDNVGSIAGQMLAIRNDQPTVILLHAILTITTYGVNLCADNIGITEKEYKEIFRSSFINPYKFVLESELAQLYIRHKIREQEMCRKTGIANISETANPKSRYCMLQNKCDSCAQSKCPIDKSKIGNS